MYLKTTSIWGHKLGQKGFKCPRYFPDYTLGQGAILMIRFTDFRLL